MPYYIYSILLLLLLNSCTTKLKKKLDNVQLEDKAGIERATGVEMLYSDSAIIRVRMIAPTMLRYIDKNNPKQVFPDGIKADFFDNSQQQTSRLVANYAEQFTKKEKIFLRDSVHIWNNKQEHLESDELIWDEQQKKIYSDKFVRITTPTQIIEGYKLISNLEFTKWQLDSVSGIIESKNIIDSPF